MNTKAIYWICFSSSLVFLFVALLLVHPRGWFGLGLTVLAVSAVAGSGHAFFKGNGKKPVASAFAKATGDRAPLANGRKDG
jgi:hypothetical protein